MEIASEFPETRYVFNSPVEGPENISFTQFADNQSSYLAGVAAALKSQSGTIGFIGGIDSWFIWTFHAGYEAGARSIDPDIEILSSYLAEPPDFSGFVDPLRAEEAAEGMFEAGADVVFHAAGDSGVGVFEAATTLSTADRHLWAIGVDSDQYESVLRLSVRSTRRNGAAHPHVRDQASGPCRV